MKSRYIITLIGFLKIVLIEAQTLDDYLLIAEKNDPQLKLYEAKYQSMLKMAEINSSLPSTNIDAGFFVQETETRVGAQKARLSISQTLPWFGTLKLKKESRILRAETELNKLDKLKRGLFLEIKTNYFELYELETQRNILRKNVEILDTYKSMALNQLANNRTKLIEVLKIKVERNEVWNKLKLVNKNINAKKKVFNLLLNRNENESIVVDSIIFTKNKLGKFDKATIDLHPEISETDNIQKSLLKEIEATTKESLPKFKFGINYIPVEKRDIPTLVDDGKDIIMPTVGISLPLFSKKYSVKKEYLLTEQTVIEATKQTRKKKLLIQFEKASSEKENILETLRTTYENMTQIEEVLKVLFSVYPTSKIDFDQILEVQQLKLKFELNIVTLEKEYVIQNAILESIITKEY